MTTLVEACLRDAFPSLATMVDYGLDGKDGTDPIAVFGCYQLAVKHDRVTADQLYKAMIDGKLTELLDRCPTVRKSSYYITVKQKGGIKTNWDNHDHECPECNYYGHPGVGFHCQNCKSKM